MDETTFARHPIWKTVQGLSDAINEIIDKGLDVSTSYVEQLRFLVTAILSHSEPPDTIAYSTSTLATTNDNLTKTLNELRAFLSNKNVAHINNSATHLQQALHLYGLWPVSIVRGGAAVQAHQAFKEYRDSANRAVETLKNALQDLEDRLDSRVSDEKTREQQSQEKLEALSRTIAELQAKITADEARLDHALTTTNEAFSNAQERRVEEFSQWLREQGDGLTDLVRPDLERIAEVKGSAEAELAKVAKLRSDVESVSGKATSAILAKDYGTYSNREWVSGVVAYFVGVSMLAVLGWYLIETIADVSVSATPSWQYVALKLGLTVTAAIAAGVMFQFGSNSLMRANINKRVQLELATIGTFLADVDDEERVKQAKLDFVDRTFGRAWDNQESGATTEADDESVLQKLAEQITRLLNRQQ